MGLFKKSEKILIKAVKFLGVDDAVTDNLKLKSTLADLNVGFNSDTIIILLFQKEGFALRVLNNLIHPSKIIEKKIIKEFKKISGYSDKQCEWVFNTWSNALSKAEYPISSKPHIKTFNIVNYQNRILSGNEITIVWNVLNYSKIYLVINNTQRIDVTNNHFYKLKPKQNTYIHLEVVDNINYFIPIKSKSIFIKVLKKINLSVHSNRKHTIKGIPINIFWESQNATSVSINSNTGDSFNNLKEKGSIEIFPSEDCIYTIVAKHDLEQVEKKIYLFVDKIPKIKNLRLPIVPILTPNLTLLDTNNNYKSYISINSKSNRVASIENVVKIHTNLFNMIVSSINSNYIIQVINKYIYDKKNTL